jgi:hypothetical protein
MLKITDAVSETLCFLVSRIPDVGQSPKKNSNNSECYTQSSESLEINACFEIFFHFHVIVHHGLITNVYVAHFI